jgi:hypothetical protein
MAMLTSSVNPPIQLGRDTSLPDLTSRNAPRTARSSRRQLARKEIERSLVPPRGEQRRRRRRRRPSRVGEEGRETRCGGMESGRPVE